MSLENKIEALTAAVVALTTKLESSNVAAPTPEDEMAEELIKMGIPESDVLVVESAPVVQAAPTSVMPSLPVFAAPLPTPAGAPFSDMKGLIDYVMSAYKALGPQKGAQIQGVLNGLGYQNINDVKPDHYAALHAGVELLKIA